MQNDLGWYIFFYTEEQGKLLRGGDIWVETGVNYPDIWGKNLPESGTRLGKDLVCEQTCYARRV